MKSNNVFFENKRINKNINSENNDEEWVDLIFRGISDLDSNVFNYIKYCKKLSSSSNFITKIPDLHLDNIEILSLGRNKIRKVFHIFNIYIIHFIILFIDWTFLVNHLTSCGLHRMK